MYLTNVLAHFESLVCNEDIFGAWAALFPVIILYIDVSTAALKVGSYSLKLMCLSTEVFTFSIHPFALQLTAVFSTLFFVFVGYQWGGYDHLMACQSLGRGPPRGL